ncbi:MAG: glycosyltransferase [Anaerolineae bacterium]|nr:glycosyltransferase [Anaerolineae bacterium]
MNERGNGACVSIIIPAYNQAHYLGEAIRSALGQSYGDVEVIVVDDGSTDGTQAVVEAFDDARLRYVYQENRGLSAARNTGIRHAHGEYLSYLDSDDRFLPEKLALLLAVLEQRPEVGLVAGQAIPVDETGAQNGRLFDQPLPVDGRELLLGNPLHVGSVLVRRSWQERAGFFDEQLRSYEDWDMWLRLARLGCEMAWVAQPVSLYRFHADQMTRDGSQMTTATFAVLDKLFADPALPASWREWRHLAYSRAHLRAAAQAYRREESLVTAGKHLEEAVALDPKLAAGGGERLAQHLFAWTDLPKIADPLSYLQRIYDNLPATLTCLGACRREALGQAAMRLAFAAEQQGDLARARTSLHHALRYQPRWLANRGVLSILVRSYLAPRRS